MPEVSRSNTASYLCWNMHVGCQEVSRYSTPGESQGTYIMYVSTKWKWDCPRGNITRSSKNRGISGPIKRTCLPTQGNSDQLHNRVFRYSVRTLLIHVIATIMAVQPFCSCFIVFILQHKDSYVQIQVQYLHYQFALRIRSYWTLRKRKRKYSLMFHCC